MIKLIEKKTEIKDTLKTEGLILSLMSIEEYYLQHSKKITKGFN